MRNRSFIQAIPLVLLILLLSGFFILHGFFQSQTRINATERSAIDVRPDPTATIVAPTAVLQPQQTVGERKREAVATLLSKHSKWVSKDETKTHLLWLSEGVQITYQEKYDVFHISVRGDLWEAHLEQASTILRKEFLAGYDDVACSLTNVEAFVFSLRQTIKIPLCEGQS